MIRFIVSIVLSVLFVLPTSAQWHEVAQLNVPRHSHQIAELPDGKILIIGGVTNSVSFLSGSLLDGTVLKSCEIFDPVSNTIDSTGSMLIPRAEAPIVTTASGDIIILGGFSSNNMAAAGGASAAVELYSVVGKSWKSIGSLLQTRRRHSACMISNDEILVVGGTDGSPAALVSCEIFRISTGTSRLVSSLPQPAKEGTLMMLDGIPVYVGARSGGRNSSRQQKLLYYNIVSDAWVQRELPSILPSGVSVTGRNDGSMVVSGGVNKENPLALSDAVYWVIGTHIREVGRMSQPRIHHVQAIVHDYFTAITGGFNERIEPLSSCDLVDLNNQRVHKLPPLIWPRAYHTMHSRVSQRDGSSQLFVIGGTSTNRRTLNSIERLTFSNVEPLLDQAIVDVNEDHELNQQVYPNPTTGICTANVPVGSTVRVTTAEGIVVFDNVASETEQLIDLSAHPRGTYYVTSTLRTHSSTQVVVRL